MNKVNNNTSEYHCQCCRYHQQSQGTVYSTMNYPHDKISKRTCVKCKVRKDEVFMDEFENGMFVCQLKLFCQERYSLINEMKDNNIK